jgi:hypothetical protein
VEVRSLTRGQITALQYHGGLQVHPASNPPRCPWLVTDAGRAGSEMAPLSEHWELVASVNRPADKNDNLLLYRRADLVAPSR